MTATNYNIEPSAESAVVSLLNAQGITAGPSLSANSLGTPRVDVRFELGAELDGLDVSGGQLTPNAYNGQFVLTVITDRDNNNASHSAFRAGVRQILAESTAAQWEAALGSRYRLLSISHLATAYDVLDQQRALDVSVMTYNAVVRFI